MSSSMLESEDSGESVMLMTLRSGNAWSRTAHGQICAAGTETGTLLNAKVSTAAALGSRAAYASNVSR